MEPRISIITIAVHDLDRAAKFYEGMGLKRHRITDGVAFFQMGGAILSLFPRESAEQDSGIGFGDGPSRVYLAYNTRSDTEVDEVLAQAENAGGRIVKVVVPALAEVALRLYRVEVVIVRFKPDSHLVEISLGHVSSVRWLSCAVGYDVLMETR